MVINLAFLTGARSEYGIAKPLLKQIVEDPDFNLSIFPDGMHLLKEFGSTVNEINNDGFTITEPIYTYNSIKEKAHQFSNSVRLTYDILKKYDIDLVYVVGDRIEAYTAALAAHFLKIPIAHFGGGTITAGAVDNFYRYNITNLSDIHFATSKNNYERLVKCVLTKKENVHFTGSTAVDSIIKFKQNKRKHHSGVVKELKINNFALMTFHPVTANVEPISELMETAIDSIVEHGCDILITYPNNDDGYESIIEVINKWKVKKEIKVVKSLGAEKYYEAIENSLFVIGNSSSGVIEAPYFNKPVINIGTRQDGRDKDPLVKDVKAEVESLINAINMGFADGWENGDCSYLYGYGDSIKKVCSIIKDYFENGKK